MNINNTFKRFMRHSYWISWKIVTFNQDKKTFVRSLLPLQTREETLTRTLVWEKIS